MTTTVTIKANAHKSSDGKQLECVVTTIDNGVEVSTKVIENGKTEYFAAFEGREILVSEKIKD